MSEKIYYVYRHVRLDTNEVFYVGKGSSNLRGATHKVFYQRAYRKSGKDRTSFWHNIANKTDYIVEIIFQSFDHDEILKKEVEFIKLYGRRDLNLGTLVNLCDGGTGATGTIISTKAKQRLSHRSKLQREEKHPRSKPVHVYLVDGSFYKTYPCRLAASRDLKVTPRNINLVLRGDYQQIKGFLFKKEYCGLFVEFEKKLPSNRKPVLCYDLNMNLIKEFESTTEAAAFIGCLPKRISAICLRKQKSKGYFFRFKTSPEEFS